ncbi:serine/threonine-protein kinase [Nocardioides rubriscoriae]|uniref:serine/threonine-protein kinase n=1 Tax=Nocardioides rubriscoriae TaxID=642762 RepID=UPI0011E057B7|nr:serine/threonine-protein kinase [Nocardioides rubriscoriae]
MTTQPREDGPAPPRRVGPYTLLAKIGEGGMGVVHLARREESGARVALKVMRPHIVGDDEARQRLAREVSSLRRIRSRWVAEIVDADPWADVPYVATRYVPGLSLHDHVQQEGPITGADLTWFAGCLAEGLASVHAAGVLHRDVKPSNVLMEGRTPILIDFGLARVADDPRLTHTGWLLGTPGYLAPEILYGDDASAASDLHSWGASVAYAATGAAPFGRGPAMAIMDRVRRGEHDLTGLTGPLRDVVAATLDPEPARRPSLEQLLAWLRPQTTRPAPVPTPAVDPFDAPLALAAQAHDRPVYDDSPPPYDQEADQLTDRVTDRVTDREAAGTTLVLPAHPPATPPPAPTLVERPPRVLAPTPPSYGHTPGYPAYDPAYDPAPTPRTPLGERLRRLGLVAAGAVLTGAATAVAPWLTLVVVVVAVWLLRSGSLAASAVGARRQLRGRRWYDGPQLLVQAPWHLLQSIPGAAMLLTWAGGLGVAAALLCYAVAAALPVSLFVTGLVLALALWWGPGGSRLRGPLGRVVDPLSRQVGAWLLATAVVLALAVVAGAYVEARGTSWVPGGGQPLSGR